MRYRINENPGYNDVPVVESVESVEGQGRVISCLGIYDDDSVMYVGSNLLPISTRRLHTFGGVSERTLSDYDDHDLESMSTAFGFQIDELIELRRLEQQHRRSISA